MSRAPLRSTARRRRGTVMILVIWIVLLLTVVAYSLSYEMRIGLKMTSQGTKRIKAQGLARIGLSKAVMDLRNDRLLGQADITRINDTLEDVWAKTDDKIDIKAGEKVADKEVPASWSAVIIDEDRKLNLNTLQTPAQAGALAYLLQEVSGMKDDVSEFVANAVIDFKDPDLMVTGGGQGSDEITYYTETAQKLLRKSIAPDWVFRPKNDVYLSISELLSIPGITTDILYGSSDQMIVDPIERAAEKKREPSKALADYVTIYGGGAVNFNTAPVKVLEAILYGATHNRSSIKWGKEIEKIRQELLRKRKNDGYGINNPGQLLVEGLPPEIMGALNTFGGSIGTASSVFTITARGEYDGVRATITAVVEVDPEVYALDPDAQRSRSSDRRRDPKTMAMLSSQPNLIFDPAVRVLSISEF